MDLGKRLAALRQRHKWTQEDVANRLGIARTTYAMYEQGRREPDTATLARLAELFGVTTDFLITGKEAALRKPTGNPSLADQLRSEGIDPKSNMLGNPNSESIIREALERMRADDARQPVDIRMIPVLGFIKAGYDLYADQQVIDYQPAATRDVSDGEYFYLVVKGDSMIDDGIREGMRVLIRRQDYVEEGKIGVVIINGDEATLKRVFYDGDNIILQSANAKYKPRILPIEEARIQGQVKQVVWDV